MNLQRALFEFFCLHRKNLLLTLVIRNLKVKYRGSLLGFVWTLMIPLAQILVYYFVYKIILQIPTPNYLAFIVSGTLPWIFFSSTINESFESIVACQGLLTQVPIPIQIMPASAALTNFINFVLALPALILVLACSRISFSLPLLLVPPLCLLLLLFAYSLAFIMAAIYVLFRDLKHIFSIGVQLWLYLTPIFYSSELIPKQYAWTLLANPLSGFFVAYRDVLIFNRWPQATIVAAFCVWTALVLVLANLTRIFLGPKLVERL